MSLTIGVLLQIKLWDFYLYHFFWIDLFVVFFMNNIVTQIISLTSNLFIRNYQWKTRQIYTHHVTSGGNISTRDTQKKQTTDKQEAKKKQIPTSYPLHVGLFILVKSKLICCIFNTDLHACTHQNMIRKRNVVQLDITKIWYD